jgi:hypothetical protein
MSEEREESVVDLGDPKYVRDRARAAKGYEIVRAAVIKNIMSGYDGRQWMNDLLEFCNVYGELFSSDALVMAARVGSRNVGMKLVYDIQLNCPETYSQMMKEAKDRADVRD